MQRLVLIFISVLWLVVFAACSPTEQANSNSTTATPANNASPASTTKIPPENIVTTSAAEVQIAPGGEATAMLQVNIASGYHINGNPSSKYQIATALSVEPGDRITGGQPEYPASLTKKFSFSPEAIAVYEGQATIKVPLKAAANAARGAQTIRAQLRVQPCDDQACYPPRNVAATLPVIVK